MPQNMALVRALVAAAAALCLSAPVAALPPLERNIAYRSPTSTIAAPALAHDVGAIARGITKRAEELYKKRSSLDYAKGGHAADELVLNYNATFGSDGQSSYYGGIKFPYSVASGDPYDDSAILWTHPVPADDSTKLPVCLRYQTSKREGSWSERNLVDDSYAWTTSDVDYSFKVETSGLKAQTQYWYRFFACHDHSLVSPTGTFKTTPSPNDEHVDSLKMAVFSCSNYPFGFFNSYAQAAKSDGEWGAVKRGGDHALTDVCGV